MKRPRRPAKKKPRKVVRKSNDGAPVVGLPSPISALARMDTTVPVFANRDYLWMQYPDDAKSREQVADMGWEPVPYIEFAGSLPGREGLVHFQGNTLMHRLRPQLTTASMGQQRFLIVSLTISEK